jgi:ABC-type polysaccharide/polyol phosphate export permease
MPPLTSAARRESPTALHQLVAAHELLWSFVRRDLIVRYRTPVMGIAWAIAPPLTQMAIFALVFSRVAHLDVGMPYAPFAYVGLAAWTLTAASLRAATTSLSSNAVLVSKMRFPREVLPLAAVCIALLDFLVAMPLTMVLTWYYGLPLTVAILFFPIVAVIHVAFVAALALLLAAANLFWRDVQPLFDVVLIVWMFATGVVYPTRGIEGRLGTLLAVNPMTRIIEAYRDVILRGRLPDALPLLGVALGAFALLAAALAVFHRSERHFAEVA